MSLAQAWTPELTLEERCVRIKAALPRASASWADDGADGQMIFVTRSESGLAAILHYLPRLDAWQVDGWCAEGDALPETGPQGETIAAAWARLEAACNLKRLAGESGEAFLARCLASGYLVKQPHPGNHAYVWQRTPKRPTKPMRGLPYPVKGV